LAVAFPMPLLAPVMRTVWLMVKLLRASFRCSRNKCATEIFAEANGGARKQVTTAGRARLPCAL